MSKKLFYLIVGLIALVAIIFSIDLGMYIRMRHRKARQKIHTEEITTNVEMLKRDNFRYKPTYKNPFLSPNIRKDSTEKVTEEIEDITLKGIVLGPGEPVVVVQDRDGNVFVLKKDRKAGDIVLLSVKPNTVKIKYKNKDYTLKIWEE